MDAVNETSTVVDDGLSTGSLSSLSLLHAEDRFDTLVSLIADNDDNENTANRRIPLPVRIMMTGNDKGSEYTIAHRVLVFHRQCVTHL